MVSSSSLFSQMAIGSDQDERLVKANLFHKTSPHSLYPPSFKKKNFLFSSLVVFSLLCLTLSLPLLSHCHSVHKLDGFLKPFYIVIVSWKRRELFSFDRSIVPYFYIYFIFRRLNIIKQRQNNEKSWNWEYSALL